LEGAIAIDFGIFEHLEKRRDVTAPHGKQTFNTRLTHP
jgi:hypothetical protein